MIGKLKKLINIDYKSKQWEVFNDSHCCRHHSVAKLGINSFSHVGVWKDYFHRIAFLSPTYARFTRKAVRKGFGWIQEGLAKMRITLYYLNDNRIALQTINHRRGSNMTVSSNGILKLRLPPTCVKTFYKRTKNAHTVLPPWNYSGGFTQSSRKL